MNNTTEVANSNDPTGLEAALDKAWETSKPQETPTEAPEQTPTQPEETETTPEAEAGEKPPTERARAPNGQFATAKQGATPEAEPTQPSEKAGSAAPQVAQAPKTLPVDVREAWGKAPKPVQDYLLKREGEVTRVLNETAEARKTHQAFSDLTAPYRPYFSAPPMQVVEGLLQTALTLRTGSQDDKAQLIANMINAQGIDLERINARLSGQAPQQQPQQFRDPRLDEFLQRQQQEQYYRQQRQSTSAQAAVEAFRKTAEFLDDVRDDMADRIHAASARGVEMTLADAYDAACWANPKVRAVIQGREADKAKATAARARATGSIKTNPAPPIRPGRDTSIDSLLDEAWAAQR
jgi:hypothetical protein